MKERFLPVVIAACTAFSLSAQAGDASPHANGDYTTRLEVKLQEGTGAQLVDGVLQSRKGVDLAAVAAVFGSAQVERLIPLPLATLDRWHREASQGAGPKPGHLALWFRVTGKDAADTARLLDRLRALPQVQHAYSEPFPELPGGKDIAPPTPNWTAKQAYAGAPPLGVNSDVAHTLVGGRGREVMVTDMEVWWTIPHEDLCKLDDPKVWLGRPSANTTTRGNHGTAVAGEIVGDRNGYGVRGISDNVTYRISSWNDGGVAAAISRGINAGKAGDIVLLEVHYRTSAGFLPAEYSLSNYNVILTGTRRGIHICEAAGNGNVNLNTVSVGGPSGYLDPSSPNFRESGAIMIGATDGEKTSRAGFSNYGRRITANGWGYRVYTTAYGALFKPNNDTRQYYTTSFSGTSSASPIVTATVACLVGSVKFQDEKTLSVQKVRDLLRKHGTPCTGSIQNRPDIGKMLADVGLPDGLAQSKEQYGLGENYVLDMSGPSGGSMALYISETIQKTNLGFNRKFHLDIGSMVPVGVFKLPHRLSLKVPNIPALKDKTFYLQGISADSKSTLR